MEKHDQTYRTGGTEPPKSHRGVIAVLLALVIFLCGVSTALGLMNIHLFRQLGSGKDTPALAFHPTQDPGTDPVSFHALGLSGETVSEFWQQYQQLPRGIYITAVTDRAAQAGLQPGDILLRFAGEPTEDVQALRTLLENHQPGELANLVIFREGQQHNVQLTLEFQP